MISVQAAQQLLAYLWPEFEERNGLVLLKTQVDCPSHNREAARTATELEAFCNHEHVLDHLAHDALKSDPSDKTGAVLDTGHPDVLAARTIGRLVTRMWAAKLREDYPNYHFRVYYTEHDDPIVRFHRIRDAERAWMTDEEAAEQIAAGTMLVIDTRTTGAAV